MFNVLLVHPPISLPGPHAIISSEPLGLACLAAYLEKNNYCVDILDAFAHGLDSVKPCVILNTGEKAFRQGLSDDEFMRELYNYSPSLIGITNNFSSYINDVISVAGMCKEVFPNVPIVIGGAHATIDSKRILEEQNSIDFVIRGEGEETLLELVNALENNLALSDIKGLSFRDDNAIIENADRPRIRDLNDLPLPARKKLPMEIYFRHKKSGLKKRNPVATLMTSRGCPFNCVFCSTKNVWKRIWRPLSPESVVDEIEHLVSDFGVRELSIVDDSFIVDLERVKNICREIVKREIDITFTISAGLTMWRLDEELIKLLKEAGMYRILLPIESGSPETLEFIRKPIDLDLAKQLVDFSKRLGLWVEGNFIIGFPYETQSDIDATIDVIAKMNLDFVHLYLAHPIPGAELCDIYIQEGLLDQEGKEWATAYNAPHGSLNFSADELRSFRDKAVRAHFLRQFAFYANPKNYLKYTWKKLSRWEDFSYFLRIVIFMILSLQKTRKY